MAFRGPVFAIFSALGAQCTLEYYRGNHERHCSRPPAPRPSERRPCRASFAPPAPPPPPPTSPPPSASSSSTPWTSATRRSVFPHDARGEPASCWWGWGAGPQGSPAGLERARRGRPCGARSRVPSAGRGGAGRPRGITLRRRAALLRPAGRRGIPVVGPAEVQVRGGRPPGDGARGEDGRARTSAGSAGRPRRRRGERRIGWQVRGGVARSGSAECAALAAGRGGDRAGPGKRAWRRPRGTREARGTAWGTPDRVAGGWLRGNGSRAARLTLTH